MESEGTHPQFRNIKTRNAQQIPSLPEEIIEEILSRLQVKTLLKFRCVSKSWCSLIGSKRFVKSHLENSTRNTSFTHHRIILISRPPHCSLKHCSLHSLLNEPVTDSFAFDYPMNTPTDSIRFVGCCNGLICILIDRKHFILWNPSTRMSKKLPDVDDKIKHGFITKYGFGFDESNGDYKVFGILSVFWITGRYQAIGKVYNLKTNSWKTIKDKDVAPFYEAGKLASGKLHWGSKFGMNSRWDIVSFDLKSEVYGMVEQPSYPEGGFHPSLGVLWGCLCVLCDYPKTSADVWVLKQYGVKESWDKVVTVPYLGDPWQGPFSTPFCIGPKGEILFIFGSTFVIYYPKDNCFQHPQIVNFDAFHEADVYIESLVSLVPDGGEQERQTQKQ